MVKSVRVLRMSLPVAYRPARVCIDWVVEHEAGCFSRQRDMLGTLAPVFAGLEMKLDRGCLCQLAAQVAEANACSGEPSSAGLACCNETA